MLAQLAQKNPRTTNWPVSAYTSLIIGAAAVITVLAVDQLAGAAHVPEFWLMTGLALVASALSFMVSTSARTAMVICPSICFTFAILLCWGLGPAIFAQTLGVLVVAVKLRLPPVAALTTLAQYTVAFAVTALVLDVSNPDPFERDGPTIDGFDAVGIVAAVATWLVVFGALLYLRARLNDRANGLLRQQLLFRSALLVLSPMLAITAHINVYTIPLIFIPLYAVGRMARLSVERDRAARTDSLTGLASRAELRRRFDSLHGRQRTRGGRPSYEIALLLLDLDRFKNVNDALGHELGDQLLIAVARRLEALGAAEGATVARLGGDEFAILVRVSHVDEACLIAQRVVDELNQPIVLEGLEGLRVDVGASVGIAELGVSDMDFATLMRHADAAMYDAKKQGATFSLSQRQNDHTTLHRLGLLADFRYALERRDTSQLRMHYQPQVGLSTGAVVGVEALLRWEHPQDGTIPTADILAIAENTPVMPLLTRFVIDEVTAQQGRWLAQGIDLRMSLNVSVRDLFSGDIVCYFASSLAEHHVPGDRMQVEITESALMADPTRAVATVSRLAELGISIALDDFGTGYSSLQHLRRLPVSEIKIDASLVRGMAVSNDDAAIVRSTIEMARALNLRTVAEGVEDSKTYQLLADTSRCTVVQGWHTGRPTPAETLTGRLLPMPVSPAPVSSSPAPASSSPSSSVPAAMWSRSAA